MHKPRPLVFKCPLTRIDVITNMRIHDGDEPLVAEGIFAVDCPCCNEQHNFCGYESRNVKRRLGRSTRVSV
jgi:hypothetical protein